MVDKQKLNELDRKRKDNKYTMAVCIMTMLLTMSFTAYWMIAEYYFVGEIVPSLLDDIVCIPVIVSFWFNAKAIIEKYMK